MPLAEMESFAFSFLVRTAVIKYWCRRCQIIHCSIGSPVQYGNNILSYTTVYVDKKVYACNCLLAASSTSASSGTTVITFPKSPPVCLLKETWKKWPVSCSYLQEEIWVHMSYSFSVGMNVEDVPLWSSEPYCKMHTHIHHGIYICLYIISLLVFRFACTYRYS